MSMINRRTILGGIAATAVPLPAPAAIVERVSPQERLNAAVTAVVDILREMNPDHADAEILRDQGSSHVVVLMKIPPKPVEWRGPGFYEIEQGDKRPIYWIERVDYTTRPGHYFRAVRRWKGHDQGRSYRIQAGNLRIVRKIEDYASV